MSSRVGVDVGGTFTDLIHYDDATGRITVAKQPTTPEAPEQGVLDAVRVGVPPDVVPSLTYFLHGTTIGLNAMLTRQGSVVGVLTTHGFRDVLELRRGDRTDAFDIFCREPAPLVPRHLRWEVSERVAADGTVLLPLVETEVVALTGEMIAAGVQSVAVVFLHSYANRRHELRAAELLREAGFDGHISLSHEVAGEYREYERTSTTAIDAYVRPKTATYLAALEGGLRDLGFHGEVLITRSGGGALSLGDARDRPFETIMSGPVAGAEGAAELARRLGIDRVITADVGGTSFDTALISNGRPQLQYEGSIENLPVLAPWVDVRSIGAGGGSVARVDAGGLLRVGPASAGAVPGPACYGRGGLLPTVTDAACVLGMLGPGRLANGWVLDRTKAEAAVATVATELAMSVQAAAMGIVQIAAAAMASAIREITVERGIDPRDCTLLPFGGAGPLFGSLLSRELSIDEVVLPPYAGNFSAWGLLGSEVTRSAARTRVLDLRPGVVAEIDKLVATLEVEMAKRGTEDEHAEGVLNVALDMRYTGQDHAITMSVPLRDGYLSLDEGELQELFANEYAVQYGHQMDEAVQVVAVRVTTRRALPPRRIATSVSSEDAVVESCEAYSFRRRRYCEFSVVDRSSVIETLSGPAIVLEQTTTTYLDAGSTARRHETGCLMISNEG